MMKDVKGNRNNKQPENGLTHAAVLDSSGAIQRDLSHQFHTVNNVRIANGNVVDIVMVKGQTPG